MGAQPEPRMTPQEYLRWEREHPSDRIELTDMGCSLHLGDIYERVSFPDTPEPIPSDILERDQDPAR